MSAIVAKHRSTKCLTFDIGIVTMRTTRFRLPRRLSLSDHPNSQVHAISFGGQRASHGEQSSGYVYQTPLGMSSYGPPTVSHQRANTSRCSWLTQIQLHRIPTSERF